jgi:hypothetical protein
MTIEDTLGRIADALEKLVAIGALGRVSGTAVRVSPATAITTGSGDATETPPKRGPGRPPKAREPEPAAEEAAGDTEPAYENREGDDADAEPKADPKAAAKAIEAKRATFKAEFKALIVKARPKAQAVLAALGVEGVSAIDDGDLDKAISAVRRAMASK